MKYIRLHHFHWSKSIALFYFSLYSLTFSAQSIVEMKDEWYQRCLTNNYTPSPIQELFERIRVNRKLTIGVIGGSITAGANASDFTKTAYGPLVVEWFRQKFPEVKIDFINAGIGATNSFFGVHRVDKDLLSHKPDFVIVEFSVNDRGEPRTKGSYEGLIRKILKSENKPTILTLGLMDMYGDSWQKYHIEVCNHYNIPFISYRNAIYPEIQCGNIVWNDLSNDEVHPNDKGHQIISNLITNFLDKNCNIKELPAPLTQNRYEQAAMYPFVQINNQDWKLTSKGYQATHKGEPLIFQLEASMITIMFEKTINPQKAANVYFTLDNGPRRKLDTLFKDGWGDYMHSEIILDSDKSQTHTVKFEYADKSGKEFILHNIQIIP